MFSLEGPTGRRFLTRSRLFDEAEWDWLVTHQRVAAAGSDPRAAG
jgi:hypothetical protein